MPFIGDFIDDQLANPRVVFHQGDGDSLGWLPHQHHPFWIHCDGSLTMRPSWKRAIRRARAATSSSWVTITRVMP